jgi:hypothetical protein
VPPPPLASVKGSKIGNAARAAGVNTDITIKTSRFFFIAIPNKTPSGLTAPSKNRAFYLERIFKLFFAFDKLKLWKFCAKLRPIHDSRQPELNFTLSIDYPRT